MKIVMICYNSDRKLVQKPHKDVIASKGPERVTSSIPCRKSGDSVSHTSLFSYQGPKSRVL